MFTHEYTRVEYPWTNPDTFWPLSFVDELLIVKNMGVEMAKKKYKQIRN